MTALDELSPASFAGVPFHIEREVTSGSRAVAIHELAGADDWVTQDRGLKASRVRLLCYVAEMAGVKPQSYALWSACESGVGLLALPHAPPRLAWPLEWERAQERDKIGFVAFEVSFADEPPAQLGVSPLLAPAAVASGFAALTSALGSALS